MNNPAEAIIEQIDGSYARLVRLYCGVPVTYLLEPSLSNGWSVKDLLGHIASWEWRCASVLSEAYDTDAPLKAMPDIDALNQENYEERREWDWTEVEFDFRQAHQSLLEVIRNLPAERLQDPFVYQSIAEETWQHYLEHIPDLDRWHKKITANKTAR